MAQGRTHGAGSGGQAVSPNGIPLRGRLPILRRATRHVLSDRLQRVSAGRPAPPLSVPDSRSCLLGTVCPIAPEPRVPAYPT